MDLELPAGYSARAVNDSDATGLIRLIDSCFSEYEGVFLEPDGIDDDLQAYATSIAGLNGEALVIEDETGIVAVVSVAPIEGTRYQLKRIYLAASLRGTGIGLTLLHYAEARALAHGAKTMELWSDTRFTRAHSFYAREGYVKQAETRDLHDSSNTTEYLFIKPL